MNLDLFVIPSPRYCLPSASIRPSITSVRKDDTCACIASMTRMTPATPLAAGTVESRFQSSVVPPGGPRIVCESFRGGREGLPIACSGAMARGWSCGSRCYRELVSDARPLAWELYDGWLHSGALLSLACVRFGCGAPSWRAAGSRVLRAESPPSVGLVLDETQLALETDAEIRLYRGLKWRITMINEYFSEHLP